MRRVRSHPPPLPPQTQEVHFFIDQRINKSEVGVLFYSNIIIMCSKIEITVKEATSLSHRPLSTKHVLSFTKYKKGIWVPIRHFFFAQ